MSEKLESHASQAFVGILDKKPKQKTEEQPKEKKVSFSKEIQTIFKHDQKQSQSSDQQYSKKDLEKKSKLIYQIQHYGKNKRLGKYLREQGHNFSDSYLRSLSIHELELELKKQDVILANKQNNNIIDKGVEFGLVFIENQVHETTDCKVKGTTEKLFMNDNFLDLLERVKLKYNIPGLQLDPLSEMMLIIIQTAMMTHQINMISKNTKKEEHFDTKCNLDEEVNE